MELEGVVYLMVLEAFDGNGSSVVVTVGVVMEDGVVIWW